MGLKWKNGERWGNMGKLGGGKRELDVDVCFLCYFVLLKVLWFAQEHHPSWLGTCLVLTPAATVYDTC